MDLFKTSRGRMLLLGVVALVAVAIAVPALAQNASETDAPDRSTNASLRPARRSSRRSPKSSTSRSTGSTTR
jgi:hypothetical protein